MAQFLRRELYARSPQRPKKGPAKFSARAVIGEALREPAHCPHVGTPRSPVVMYEAVECGGDHPDDHSIHHPTRNPGDGAGSPTVPSAEALYRQVKSYASNARVTIRDGSERRLTANATVIASDVVSVPWPTAEVEANADLGAHVRRYFDQALNWLHEDIRSRGGVVILAVVHWDEDHPHMHVISLPGRGTAKALHPGFVAQAKANTLALEMGAGEAEALREGDAAYKAAMTSWLDTFQATVSAEFALARKGTTPTRRVSWAEHKIEKHKAMVASLEERVRELRAAAEELERNLAEARTTYRNGRSALLEQMTEATQVRDAMHDARRERDRAEMERDRARQEENEARAAEKTALDRRQTIDEAAMKAEAHTEKRMAQLTRREERLLVRKAKLKQQSRANARNRSQLGALKRTAVREARSEAAQHATVTLSGFSETFETAVLDAVQHAGLDSDDPVAVSLRQIVAAHALGVADLDRRLRESIWFAPSGPNALPASEEIASALQSRVRSDVACPAYGS